MGLGSNSSASQQPTAPLTVTTVTTTTTTTTTSAQPTAVKHILSTQGAAAVSTIVLYPMDFIRMRFMSQDGTVHRQHNGQTYRSIHRAFATVYREEGWRAFFRGCHVAVLGAVTSWGVYMFLYRSLCNALDVSSSYVPKSGWDRVEAFIRCSFLSGIASCSSAIVCNPIWLLKTRMQLDVAASGPCSNTSNYSSFTRGLMFAARCDGFLSLWRGVSAQILLGLPNALNFPIYEALKSYHIHHTRRVNLNAYEICLYSTVAKLIVTFFTHPIHVLKTRLQDHRSCCGELRYTSLIQSTLLIWKMGRWHGVYRGIAPSFLQAAPRSALTYVLYEYFMQLNVHYMGGAGH